METSSGLAGSFAGAIGCEPPSVFGSSMWIFVPWRCGIVKEIAALNSRVSMHDRVIFPASILGQGGIVSLHCAPVESIVRVV